MKFHMAVRIVVVGTLLVFHCSESIPVNASSVALKHDKSDLSENASSTLPSTTVSPNSLLNQNRTIYFGSSVIDKQPLAGEQNATIYNATQLINARLNNTSDQKQVFILSPDVLDTLENYMDDNKSSSESKEAPSESKEGPDESSELESQFLVRLARALQHVRFFPLVPETVVLNSEEVIEYTNDQFIDNVQRGRFANRTSCTRTTTQSNDIDTNSTTIRPTTQPQRTQHQPRLSHPRDAQFSNNVYNGPVIVISNVKDLKIVNPPSSSNDNCSRDMDDLDDDFEISGDLLDD